jgi:membrane-bound lytic murein transglycosylase MltF
MESSMGAERVGRMLRVVSAAWICAWLLAGSHALAQAKAEAPQTPIKSLTGKSWTGDFDGMVERRAIRIGVPYSRSLYYHDRGHERGITAQAVREFERYINKKYRKTLAKRPITVLLVPTTRDDLIPALLDGSIDIAAGNITITPARREKVDFSDPVTAPFAEIIVTGPKGPELKTIDDLAGKDVYARPVTSYYESLTALNEKFKAAGKPQMRIIKLPDPLEDEDKLDMVNAGLLGPVVVDEWVAKLWKPILPKIVLHEDIEVREKSEIGWAFRKNSPRLAAEVNEFNLKVAKKQGMTATLYRSFAAKIRKAGNAGGTDEVKRFESLVGLFRKYGERYGFDYLMLTAQGFQESQLNQEARSHVGAIGVMQVMPATGKELKVGDINQVEPNIHAGAKYMDTLIKVYFPDAHLDEANRTLFAFAAYNAGPNRVARLRKQAEKEGYNPDIWFNNVERVLAKKVGQEPVTYVRNIYKYYVSYKLAVEAAQEAREAAQGVDKKSN